LEDIACGKVEGSRSGSCANH